MDKLTLVTLLACFISVFSAVISVWFTRRGGDGELQADVEELALLVERMGKAQRRERMAKVRQGAGGVVAPPGGSPEASQPDLDLPIDIKSRKALLRRKFTRGGLQ